MSGDYRLQQLRAAMRARGVSRVVAVSSSYHNFLDLNPVLVCTGFKSMGDSALIVNAEGGENLIVSPYWDAFRARSRSGLQDIAAVDDAVAYLLSKAVPAHVAGATALAGLRRLPTAQAGAIRKKFADAVDGDALLEAAGNSPDPSRLAAARRAVEVAEEGYRQLLPLLVPGSRECDIAARIYTEIKKLGADDNFMLLTSARHGRGITTASRKLLEAGDTVVIEITPSIDGQFVQLPRTAYVGVPPRHLRRDAELLLQVFEHGLALCRPGARVCDVARGMNEVLARAGYGDYCCPPYMRVRGHGMGNVSNAPGDVTVDNDSELKEGDVFVLHPEQYLPESGYLLLGEPIAITADGARVLTSRRCRLDAVEVA